MTRMSKEHWLDAILEVVGEMAGTHERAQLKSMTRRQLVAVEFIVVAMRDSRCTVGCGDCVNCDAQNAKAKAEADRDTKARLPFPVTVLPMTAESRKWVQANKGKRSILIKWDAERMTVRAPNGRQRTFGPRECAWSKAVL